MNGGNSAYYRPASDHIQVPMFESFFNAQLGTRRHLLSSYRPTCRARKREGRCFELAWRSLAELEEPTPWLLVHGSVRTAASSLERIAHAWLETETEVFDPIKNRFFDKADWYAFHNASVVASYDRQAAFAASAPQGHYGPW
jgi:hypothetical protein